MFRWTILQCKIPADEETLNLVTTSVCCPKLFRLFLSCHACLQQADSYAWLGNLDGCSLDATPAGGLVIHDNFDDTLVDVAHDETE